MIYLILAILCSVLVSLVLRISEKYIKSKICMHGANYFVCSMLAIYYLGDENIFSKPEGIEFATGLGIFNGILYLTGFLLLQIDIEKNGIVLSTIFMKLGVLVPTFVSVLVFGEKLGIVQLVGFVIAIVAIVMINFEKGQVKINFKVGLILMLLSSGMGDTMSKIYEEFGTVEAEELFLFISFVSAFLTSITLIVVKKQKVIVKDILFGMLLGIPNYHVAKFLLQALRTVPATVAYPTYSTAGLLLVSIIGILIFKEKISKVQKVAIGAILLSLVLLNV